MAFSVDTGGDSFSPGDPPHGICVALDDDALEPNPTWTRLDDPQGYGLSPIALPDASGYQLAAGVEINRGRDSELDKTQTGTATVRLLDHKGVLDPTNTGGPLYGKIKPNLQAAIARWNPVTGSWSTRFRGFISELGYAFDVSDVIYTVTMDLVDGTDLLADIQMVPGAGFGDPLEPGSDGWIHYRGGPGWQRQVNRRIIEVLEDAGWPSDLQRIFSGNVTVQDRVYERNASVMEPLLEAADAEFPSVANLYFDKDGVLTFHGRFARFSPETPGYQIGYFQTASADISDSDASIAPCSGFSFRLAKRDVINSALSLPLNVSEEDVDAQLVEDATSKGEYGVRSLDMENLITYYGVDNSTGDFTTAVEETKLFADYYVDNYKQPRPRVEPIVFRARHPDNFNGPAIWDLLNEIDIGDRLLVQTSHPGGGGFDEEFFVEGIHEEDAPLDGSRHDVTMTLDVSPRAFYDANPFSFSGAGDNDAIADAFWLLSLHEGITSDSVGTTRGMTNEGDDPDRSTSEDPIVQEFGSLYASGQEYDGVDTVDAHDFKSAWWKWKAPPEWVPGSAFGVGISGMSARCCLLICTIGSGPPPAHGDYTALSSDHVALADTAPFTDLAAGFVGTISAGDTVYIGVGVLDDATDADFTISWEWDL